MKKSTKLIISGVVIAVVGVIIALASLAAAGWKFNDNYEMKTFTESGNNTDLNIVWKAGNVKTEFYDGDKIEITYPSSKMYKIDIKEDGNALTVKSKNRYLLWIGPIKVPDTVIKLPKNTVYNLNFYLSAGNANLADGIYENVKVDISAGSLKCSSLTCNRLDADLSAGNVEIGTLNANYLKCDISAGGTEISNAVCPEILIDISAGSVNMTIDGEKALYTITTDVSAGKCNISSQHGTSATHRLDVDVSAGNVNVTFTK